MLDWFIARVKPRHEHRVETYLAQWDIETFAPEIMALRSGRQSQEPLFPGYLFARLSTASREWPIIRWAPGVRYFLPSQDAPLPVDDVLIEDLRTRVQHWNGGGWLEAFKPGDAVVMASGPFRTVDAIFQRYLPGKERCEILISLLGSQRTVRTPVADLRSPAASKRFASGETSA